MELQKLNFDPATLTGDFQPIKMVERYESLIWTERYSSSGDFVLTTSNIEETLNLLPLESVVTIRESTVPMVVEVHKLSKPMRDVPRLEVRGRTCETWLERRAAALTLAGTSFEDPWEMSAATASDAAYKAMRWILGDVERFQGLTSVLAAVSPALSALDAIPQANLPLPLDYNPSTGAW